MRAASCFCSFLFGFYFEWGLSTKLINIIVWSHLFSWGELPAEIQTGQKDTDGLLRIPGVCLPLEQQTCVRATARPHEGRSLKASLRLVSQKTPIKGFIYLEMKDEPFNPFLQPWSGLLTSGYVLIHKRPKFSLYQGFLRMTWNSLQAATTCMLGKHVAFTRLNACCVLCGEPVLPFTNFQPCVWAENNNSFSHIYSYTCREALDNLVLFNLLDPLWWPMDI